MKETLALVCIVKNETKYILEWIAHYRTIGVSSIFVYDNGTTDDSDDLLGKLSEHGIIGLKRWNVSSEVSPQLTAYSDAVFTLRDKFEFLAFFDADEFLVPMQDIAIVDWLNSLPKDVGAVAINQHVFGSSNHKTHDNGLVVERFELAAENDYRENLWVKSIYRSENIDRIVSPHVGALTSGSYISSNGESAFPPGDFSGQSQRIDFEMFKLNHYILKSLEEFLVKRARGGAASDSSAGRLARYSDMAFFHGREGALNKVPNTVLSKSSPILRAEMRRIATQIGLSLNS